MLNISRRDVVGGAGSACALGVNRRHAFVSPVQAQPVAEARKVF
jgi:hypothetical protein